MSETGSGPRRLWLRKVVTRPLVFEPLEVDLALRGQARQKRAQGAGGVLRQRRGQQKLSKAKRCAPEILDPSLCFAWVSKKIDLALVAFWGPCLSGARGLDRCLVSDT